MTELKYIFTGEEKRIYDITLKRIMAVRDFGNVKEGTLGGWIEKDFNLSHRGNCWVADEAMVHDNAVVKGNGLIKDYAIISGTSVVSGDSVVCGQMIVYGDSFISGVEKFSGTGLYRNNGFVDYSIVKEFV